MNNSGPHIPKTTMISGSKLNLISNKLYTFLCKNIEYFDCQLAYIYL